MKQNIIIYDIFLHLVIVQYTDVVFMASKILYVNSYLEVRLRFSDYGTVYSKDKVRTS